VKRSDVIWNTRKEEVFEEIAKLLHIEKADSSTPGWFSQRMPAIKLILARTTTDKLWVDSEVDRITREGYPERVKRRGVEASAGAGPSTKLMYII
jgi:hypothetical protein